jgi:hypothetical protein
LINNIYLHNYFFVKKYHVFILKLRWEFSSFIIKILFFDINFEIGSNKNVFSQFYLTFLIIFFEYYIIVKMGFIFMIIYILNKYLSGLLKILIFMKFIIIYSCNNKTMTKIFYSILENLKTWIFYVLFIFFLLLNK